MQRQFIANVASTVTFGSCAAAGGTAPDDDVEREVFFSTGAPMEGWLEGYLSRLFALVRRARAHKRQRLC